MFVPNWIWLVFTFVLGCCVGSFLNVVIYRMPLDLSLVRPGSRCPTCGKSIHFYDNIPLFSWLILRGRCRYCKAAISVRYFIIELLTGLLFAGLFALYFIYNFRSGLISFLPAGWFIYLLHIAMFSAFLAASAIDLQLSVIPLGICWFVTAIGLAASTAGGFIIEPAAINHFRLLPTASADTAALAAGAAVGLAVAIVLLITGVIKRSYESANMPQDSLRPDPHPQEDKFNHRREILREVLFLLPIIICSAGAWLVLRGSWLDSQHQIKTWWLDFSQVAAVKGFLGSLWGYFLGCCVVWTARILGTLAFGKEAMGLGDVHLMGAAGAVIGPVFVAVAFFIAPFFGLAWAGCQMFFKKTRQIPYGPFLSLGVLAVIIFHDQIISRFAILFIR